MDIGERIEKIFECSKKQYGCPRIHSALLDDGVVCGHNRAAKIMRNRGIRAAIKRKNKITTDSNHRYPVAPNIVNSQFKVDAINKVWVSDITHIWTNEGLLYLCIVLDLFARKVVGWSMSPNIDTKLVSDAFTKHRATHDFRALQKKFNVVKSMRRNGNCGDNARAESFLSTLKNKEVFTKN